MHIAANTRHDDMPSFPHAEAEQFAYSLDDEKLVY